MASVCDHKAPFPSFSLRRWTRRIDLRRIWRDLLSGNPIQSTLRCFARNHPRAVVIQIGAHDGQTNDPLFPFLILHDWSGVLVEPLPAPFKRLQAIHRDRPRLRLARVAVGDEEAVQTLWTVQSVPGLPPWAPQLASFRKDVILKHADRIPNLPDLLAPVSVPCLRLDSLLARFAITDFDLLHVDAEGLDAAILRQVNFLEHHPKVILFEHKHLSPQDRAECEARLRAEGFVLACRHGDTIAFRGLS